MELKLIQPCVADKNSAGYPAGGAHLVGLYVDMETGVEYFAMTCSNAGAITPRLQSDGKPYVHPAFRK